MERFYLKKKKVNILLVEVDAENLLTLETILDRNEYQIKTANSGSEALKYLAMYDFAIAILDVQNLEVNGLRLVKDIKAHAWAKNIPILLLTENPLDTKQIITEYSIGTVDYIMKPIDPFILKQKINGFIEYHNMKKKLMEQAEELTERKKEIEFLAKHNYLTHLANHRLFHDRLQKKIQHAKENNETFGMVFLDLDGFKYMNDSLGHLIGDRILQEVAKRLNTLVRKTDLVARTGGDEFSILLSNINREQGIKIAERLISGFKRPFYIDNYELFILTCIGLSIFPYDGEDSITLIKNTDVALNRAKEQGKNKYEIFHSGMNISFYQSSLLQRDIQKAIERDEFELVYQPRIDLQTGLMIGAEVSLQWNHSKWGMVLSNEFIPIAEETDQMVDLIYWILAKVCKQINKWKEKHLQLVPIAIQFPAQIFLQKDMITQIKKVLTDNNVEPNLLEIGISQCVFLENKDHLVQSVNQLRSLGLTTTLTNFEISYSSLKDMVDFPFDSIKIDKSFIKNISHQLKVGKAILDAIMVFARNLDVSVIIDGLETEEQLNVIAQYPCWYSQGTLFCFPIMTTDFEKILSNKQQLNFKVKKHINLVKNFPQKGTNPYPFKHDQDMNDESFDKVISQMAETYSLTSRESEVLELMLKGLSNKEISQSLYISEHTVKNHITKILQKLNVSDRVKAISLVYEKIFF
jgi:diguanylate cyclase (GGDEF)-like protein